ncbi:hypothetical protein PQX77_005600 [Marasmius sp. AFHP31]|nr:hypothetical protein PQX77_005600 [Marasmius sp. AFHP31]
MQIQPTQPLQSLTPVESTFLISSPPTSPLPQTPLELNEAYLPAPLQTAKKVSLSGRWVVPVLIHVGKATERTMRKPSQESIDSYSFPPLPSPPPARSRLSKTRSSVVGRTKSGDEIDSEPKKTRVKRRPASLDLTKTLSPSPVPATTASSSTSASSSSTLVDGSGRSEDGHDNLGCKAYETVGESQITTAPAEIKVKRRPTPLDLKKITTSLPVPVPATNLSGTSSSSSCTLVSGGGGGGCEDSHSSPESEKQHDSSEDACNPYRFPPSATRARFVFPEDKPPVSKRKSFLDMLGSPPASPLRVTYKENNSNRMISPSSRAIRFDIHVPQFFGARRNRARRKSVATATVEGISGGDDIIVDVRREDKVLGVMVERVEEKVIDEHDLPIPRLSASLDLEENRPRMLSCVLNFDSDAPTLVLDDCMAVPLPLPVPRDAGRNVNAGLSRSRTLATSRSLHNLFSRFSLTPKPESAPAPAPPPPPPTSTPVPPPTVKTPIANRFATTLLSEVESS